eukprot:4806192-Amphidinium_carterae.1
MKRLQLLGLPKSAKSRIMAAFWSQGMCGAEVNGLSQALLRKLRSAGRAAFGKGFPGWSGWHTTRGFVPWCQASAT